MSGLNGPWLSNQQGDENDSVPQADGDSGADWNAEARCSWCDEAMPVDNKSAFCSKACRAAAKSDREDFNPTWLDR